MSGIAPTPLGFKLSGLLALLCASYEALQVIRDEPSDRQSEVRTTAVLLGPAKTGWIFRALALGAAAYGALARALRASAPSAVRAPC